MIGRESEKKSRQNLTERIARSNLGAPISYFLRARKSQQNAQHVSLFVIIRFLFYSHQPIVNWLFRN